MQEQERESNKALDGLLRPELALELIDVALVWCDNQGSLVWCNRSFEELIERAREEIVGHCIHDMIFNDKEGEGYRLKMKDGSIRHLEIHQKKTKEVDEDGDFTLYSIRDVTAKREAELSSQKANAFINILLENIPDMVFVKDAKDLKFVRLNKAAEEIIGQSRDRLYGKTDYDFFSKEAADFFTAKDREVLSSGKILDIPEEEIVSKTLGKRYLHTKKVPINDSNGAPEYLLGISEDITKKRRIEELRLQLKEEEISRKEAEKGLKTREDFISIAAHELRTPITPLKMQLEFIPEYLKGAKFPHREEALALLEKSRKQLDAFILLVDKLLDLSRITSGRLSLSLEKTDLKTPINSVIDKMEYELSRAGSKLDLELEDNVIGLFDPTRIEQVLSNLLGNAIKFGGGKPIKLSLKKRGSNAQITIEDNGIGIPIDKQKLIFQVYERAASNKRFPGLGVGLYVSKEIVSAHHGLITVESEPGKGSCFQITMPLSVDEFGAK